jgi:hypothetical protein
MTIFLVSWQYAQMHQIMFFTPLDVNKKIFHYYVQGGMAVSANASELVFIHFRRE